MPVVPCPKLPDRYEPVLKEGSALLGSGGMADVFRARDRLLEEEVAIKVIRPEVMVEDDFRSRFEREVSVSASVQHPHLVPLHDLGELEDGRPYLALALANSGSLLELRRMNPPWAVLWRLLDQTLAALACLHAHGILHQDMKLSNVLIHRSEHGTPRAWLSDLGLARAMGAREHFQGSLAGTLAYMPWEVLTRNYSEICPASDLFAVGVLIYRLVTGTNPFPEQNWSEQVARRASPPTTLPIRKGLAVPKGLDEIVFTLLNRDPRARFDLCADLRSTLAVLERLDEPGAMGLIEDDAFGSEDNPFLHRSDLVTDHGIMDLSAADRAELAAAGIPHWHRPTPPPIPFRPPNEPGRSARARASLPLFALREVPLVGRAMERQRLWDLARLVASSGRPRVIIVQGEAGVGKSRLVRSVIRPLQEGGQALTTEVYHTPGGGVGDGYAGAVRRMLRPEETEPRSLAHRLERWIVRDRQLFDESVVLEADLLSRWACPTSSSEPVSPSVAREYLFKHLIRQSWRGLSLLVIEDAHCCSSDEDGAALAATVLQLDLPVLAIVTCRPSPAELHPAAASALQALLALGAELITLERIPPADMSDLIEECLPLEESLSSDIIKKSEGNPLFARELIKQLCNRSILKAVDHRDPSGVGLRYRLCAPLGESIPEDILSLFEARITAALLLSRDPEATGFALDVLGVAQGGLPWRVLEEAAGPGLRAVIDAALVRDQDGVGVLDHSILGQILKERVGERRNTAHVALARAWAGYSPEPRTWRAVGKHELAAGRFQQAIEPLRRAIEGQWVTASAGDLRSTAIDLNHALRQLGDRSEAWFIAQLAMARAELATGNRAEALKRVEILRAENPPPTIIIEVVAQYIEILEYQDRARRGIPALDEIESLALLPGASPHIQLRFLQARALCLLTLGRHGAAERQVRRALLLTESDSRRAELLDLLGSCLEPSNPHLAQGVLKEAEIQASKCGYRSLQAQVLARIARLHGVQGRWEEGQVLAEEAERLALATGFHSLVPHCRNARAECLRFQGRTREAETLYQEGRRWACATGQKAWCYAFDLNLGLCALNLRDHLTLRAHLDALSREANPRWEPYLPAVAGLEAAARLLEGQSDKLDLSESLAGRLVSMGLDGVFTLTILARILKETGQSEISNRLTALADSALIERNLSYALLEPMLEVFEERSNP